MSNVNAASCLKVGITGQDEVTLNFLPSGAVQFSATGCRAFLARLRELAAENQNPKEWSLPDGTDHVAMLVREIILRVQGKWEPPFREAEICHCRAVSTQIVDACILNGGHSSERVSRETSASTSCGTCRSDVEKMIAYRVLGNLPR